MGALIFLILSMSGSLWLLARNRPVLRRFTKNRPAGQAAPEYYNQMLAILRRKGFSKWPAETGAEFAKRVERPLGSSLPARITDQYYQERFGKQPLDSDTRTEIRLSLRRWAKGRLR